MPRRLRPDHGRWLRVIPRFCTYKHLPPGVVVRRPIKPIGFPNDHAWTADYAVYVRDRVVGYLFHERTRWGNYWRGWALSVASIQAGSYDCGRRTKVMTVWAILAAVARSDSTIIQVPTASGGRYSALAGHSPLARSCMHCILRDLGYCLEEPPRYDRRPTRRRNRADKRRKTVWKSGRGLRR